ncbi:MAG: hybrid sensor histidine kinase/response regulator, partial [Rubrivivax sp.]|nr:hybrid sensor histidine kinase/response regulator [Rubrivivax sp.]
MGLAGSALADVIAGAAGFTSGALSSLGLVLVCFGWRQRRAMLGLAGALVLLTAGLLAAGLVATQLGLLLLVPVLLLTLWLTHRALRALHAVRGQHADVQRRLARRELDLEQVRAELQQAQASAEAADQAKARFLAAASHDLRQPAHALGLYTAALRAGPLTSQQAELAERMQGSLAALDTLFAALLDVSRMDAGAVLPQWDTVPLAPLLRRLADEWAPQAEARGLRLALHVSDPRAMTVTDPLLLERVLRNLLANAVKYTPRGGVLLACRERTAPDGLRHHRIEVWDSGAGIAPADQGRVFEEFFQAGSGPAAGAGRGLGLGLAIVQRLVRLLQLRVQLHSQPGRGTVFLLEGLAPAGLAPQAVAAARHEMRRLAGLRVAVLEDDEDVRDAMRRLLQLWDCQVADGNCAAELLLRQPAAPQAVVADLRLAEGCTGVEELRVLQQAWGAPVPVLWISGETAADGLRALLPAGAQVLSKPVSPARLRAWLEQRLPDGGVAPSAVPTPPERETAHPKVLP